MFKVLVSLFVLISSILSFADAGANRHLARAVAAAAAYAENACNDDDESGAPLVVDSLARAMRRDSDVLEGATPAELRSLRFARRTVYIRAVGAGMTNRVVRPASRRDFGRIIAGSDFYHAWGTKLTFSWMTGDSRTHNQIVLKAAFGGETRIGRRPVTGGEVVRVQEDSTGELVEVTGFWRVVSRRSIELIFTDRHDYQVRTLTPIRWSNRSGFSGGDLTLEGDEYEENTYSVYEDVCGA